MNKKHQTFTFEDLKKRKSAAEERRDVRRYSLERAVEMIRTLQAQQKEAESSEACGGASPGPMPAPAEAPEPMLDRQPKEDWKNEN